LRLTLEWLCQEQPSVSLVVLRPGWIGVLPGSLSTDYCTYISLGCNRKRVAFFDFCPYTPPYGEDWKTTEGRNRAERRTDGNPP
jgi:hypothetical protein